MANASVAQAVNRQTVAAALQAARTEAAEQAISYDPEHPSAIALPIVEEAIERRAAAAITLRRPLPA